MEKVVPFFKPFTTIFYIKIFKLEKVRFGLNKFWTGLIWIQICLNRLEPVLSTSRHCARVPPFGAPIPPLPCAEARHPPARPPAASHRRPPVRLGPLPIPCAAWHDPKTGPPPLRPLTVTALKGVVVDRSRASIFSPVAGAEAKLQRQPGSTLCALAVAEVLVPHLPECLTPPPPGGHFPVEPLRCYAARAFELSQPVLHRTTRRAKSRPPSLRH
jgi:hypothetical protein